MNKVSDILQKHNLNKDEIVHLLQLNREDSKLLFSKAQEVKEKYVGNTVYLRGLVEFSNMCRKNCLYCGIRAGNTNVNRYDLSDEAIIDAAVYSWKQRFGSIVLQSGECKNEKFSMRIENLLKTIHSKTNNELGVTLSLGEQSYDTFRRWRNAGAHRYLLRIEASNRELYNKLHPHTQVHDYDERLASLKALRDADYQVGSGTMIGLPFQTTEHLADDLLFLRDFDIDMVGMGPYIEHEDTPLFTYRHQLSPQKERFFMTLKMIAILRILVPDINMAAATALQAIDPVGREKAIQIGANVIMPNVTPAINRNDYLLYDNKPCTDEGADDCVDCIDARVRMAGNTIAYGEKGNPLHYYARKSVC